MTERIRITRVKAGKTLAGHDVAELYSHDTRLKFPALILFNVAELIQVGIDPNNLTEKDTHCNFWAHYEFSEKKTGNGNPYKDVVSLEPIGSPTSTDDAKLDEILGELHAIKAILLAGAPQPATEDNRDRATRIQKLNRVVDHTATTFDDEDEDDDHFVGSDADPQATNDPESEPEPEPLGEREAMLQFYGLSGPAIAEGRLSAADANDLSQAAGNGGQGWIKALAELKRLLAA